MKLLFDILNWWQTPLRDSGELFLEIGWTQSIWSHVLGRVKTWFVVPSLSPSLYCTSLQCFCPSRVLIPLLVLIISPTTFKLTALFSLFNQFHRLKSHFSLLYKQTMSTLLGCFWILSPLKACYDSLFRHPSPSPPLFSAYLLFL